MKLSDVRVSIDRLIGEKGDVEVTEALIALSNSNILIQAGCTLYHEEILPGNNDA